MAAAVSCEKRLQRCQEELNIVLEQLQECQSQIVEYNPERIRMLEGMKEQRDELIEEKRLLKKRTIDLQQQYDELLLLLVSL